MFLFPDTITEANPLDTITPTGPQLLADPNTDQWGIVDTPLQSGPLPFDILGSVFLYLEDNDLRSLLAISRVCRFWRSVSNLLPQWTAALYLKLPLQFRATQHVRDECVRLAKAEILAKRDRKRRDIENQEIVQRNDLRIEYDKKVRAFSPCWEGVLFIILIVLGLATAGMWIGAMASNREWPAHIAGKKGEKTALRFRRFAGYPGLCDGHQYRTICKDDNGDEYDCVLWKWSCLAFKDVIGEGTSDPRARWICPGNEAQLKKLERAAFLQLVGMPPHIIFISVIFVSMILSECRSVRRAVSSVLAFIGILGLGICSALMLAALPIIEGVFATSCSLSAPTAEDLGWKRSDDMMASFNAMSLLCAFISAFLLYRREHWVAEEHERRYLAV